MTNQAGFARYLVLLVFACSSIGLAKPVVEESERLGANWGALRVTFYGEAQSDKGYDAGEKAAWQDGLTYSEKAIAEFYQSKHGKGDKDAQDHARKAADRIVRSTYSTNTTYFSDGRVRVELENSLARALRPGGIVHAPEEVPQETDNSGLILELDRSRPPQATYRVVDRTGQVLFKAQDVREDSFKKNLMGRWFIRPTERELQRSVGQNPVRLKVIRSEKGAFVVDRADWLEATERNRALLANAKIVVALPR